MENLTPDRELLTLLARFGIGNYVDIMGIVPKSLNVGRLKYTPILKFLEHLEAEGLIKIDDDDSKYLKEWYRVYNRYPYNEGNPVPIKAAITKSGIDFIKNKPAEGQSVVNNYTINAGDRSQINQGSPDASIEISNPSKKNKIDLVDRLKKWILLPAIAAGVVFYIIRGINAFHKDSEIPKKDSASSAIVKATITQNVDTIVIPPASRIPNTNLPSQDLIYSLPPKMIDAIITSLGNSKDPMNIAVIYEYTNYDRNNLLARSMAHSLQDSLQRRGFVVIDRGFVSNPFQLFNFQKVYDNVYRREYWNRYRLLLVAIE